MDTLLVRLKAYDARRGYVLRTFTYRGIKIQVERGWFRVTTEVGEYLRTVHEIPRDPQSPLAFDVCTDDEARAIDAAEKKEVASRQNATDALEVALGRGESGALTTADLAGGKAPAARGGGTPVPAAPPAAAAPPGAPSAAAAAPATAPSSATPAATGPSAAAPAATAPGAAAGAVFPSVEPPDGGAPKARKGSGS
jgi:hypothetical protein